jgi:hypothetical protein
MRLWQTLNSTSIGRALVAYGVDLPRWTLANIIFSMSLAPVILALFYGVPMWIGLFTLPALLAGAGIVNMASRVVFDESPRWRGVIAHPTTFIVAFMIWIIVVVVLTLLFSDPPLVIFVPLCSIVLALLMVGVFALLVPALLKVSGSVIWRNALVLAVSYPMVSLGLLALMAAGIWITWVSRGALLLAVPSLWVIIAVFSTHDLIERLRS